MSALEAVEAALTRAARLEPWLHAFAWLDPQRARRLARERVAGSGDGVLEGLPVGVKDIVDTAGIPTERGSALFAGRVPARSATIVERLERAGAIVLGKTVTAELAYYQPGATVNPYDRSRTPGGSSMGSAAAVAAGIVPMAVATQTNGSTIRPAAFCGIVGFKPSLGRIPTDGILEFARTLDTVGALATSVEHAARLAAVMAGDDPGAWSVKPLERPRLALVRTGDWDRAQPEGRARFELDCDALSAAGAAVESPPLLDGLDEAVPLLRTIMSVEGARALGPLVDRRPELASGQIRALIEEGRATPNPVYTGALAARERLIASYRAWAAAYDAIVTLPAAGEAPPKDSTGDPRFCTRWTLIGAPAITLPTGLGPAALPLGLQLVGVPGDDARLLAAARWVEEALPRSPAPRLAEA